ncbi:MAG: DUF1259 domain-containing protein, partial [Bryobacteraceae bacterium]
LRNNGLPCKIYSASGVNIRHNHMIDEQPRVFFVHYWKIATPQDLADGLRATLAAVHIREK